MTLVVVTGQSFEQQRRQIEHFPAQMFVFMLTGVSTANHVSPYADMTDSVRVTFTWQSVLLWCSV